MRLLFLLFIFTFIGHTPSFAQSGDSLRNALTVDFEVRPRAEFRDNFMLVASDSVMPEYFASQRNRLSVTYSTRRLKFHASPQEIHVWGKSGEFSRVGSVNAFELYIEPLLSRNLSVRIGRQALSLDNGRLFSAAPWSQQSRSHEGIRVLYSKKLTTDLTVAFTRPYGKIFDAAFSPVASNQYKLLLVHHLKHRISNRFTVTTINTAEVFEKADKSGSYYQRFTNGGRIEYSDRWFYGTLNAYYQYGNNAAAKQIRAYYLQPEMSANLDKMTLRLGAEILSGNRVSTPTSVSASFVPLYGVTWKFMGNMNLFTKFPADLNEKGLVNPYLFLIFQASKKLSLRADSHLFYSQYPLTMGGEEMSGKYLGFENDFSLNYKPVRKLEIIFGFSYAVTQPRMELLKKVPDSTKIPVWSYLMISYTPRLLNLTRK